MNLHVGQMLHPIILVVVGELHVEVEHSRRVDKYVLRAEWFWVWAVGVGDGVIAGPDSDYGCACKEKHEPAEEG